MMAIKMITNEILRDLYASFLKYKLKVYIKYNALHFKHTAIDYEDFIPFEDLWHATDKCLFRLAEDKR